MEDKKKSNDLLPPVEKLTLHARGGLGGQLLAVSYGLWAPQNCGRSVHLKFHDGGTSYRPLALEKLLHTSTFREYDMSYEQITEFGNKTSQTLSQIHILFPQKIYSMIKSIFMKLRLSKRAQDSKDFEDITVEKLNSISPDTVELYGYTIDYRVFEQTIPVISKCLTESGLPNFLHNAGTEDSIAIHWRLGDYLGNEFHGSIPVTSLLNALSKLDIENDTPIKIFTDSPEYALEQIQNQNYGNRISVQSSDIWSDLFNMSRSKYFIGNHSSISMLAALAISYNSNEAQILFPDKWFLEDKNSSRFYPPVAYNNFKTYSAGF